MRQHSYTVKEFSLNPSRLIHRALNGEEEVVITLRGIPAVRLVPLPGSAQAPSVLDLWEAMPGMAVARGPMVLPRVKVALQGPGPSGGELVGEERR